MRFVFCLFLVMVTGATLGTPTEAQVGETYCSVTGISARQLSNGVQVTIEADGEMHWWVEWDDVINSGGGFWKEFEWGWDIEFTEDFKTLPIYISNAKSKIGAGFVPVSKYPVSHAEISIPDWWVDREVGIRIDLVNYLGLVSGEGDDEHWRYDFHYDS
ncbi:MAG: hypothetical protein JXA57_06085, partial [Armatimonadetes bacterium]|nr:hypothetical protein [Armatimonadota bacterium]